LQGFIRSPAEGGVSKRQLELKEEDAVAADAALTHELESLYQKVAGLHQKRRSQPAARPSAKKPDRLLKTAEEHGLHKEILQFVKLIADYVEEAKGNVLSHPSASVLGVMVVGILIGRLLGRH
jgi:ElaB/YqjD/DUF883 family membrane-anchored ribosome-binding protein